MSYPLQSKNDVGEYNLKDFLKNRYIIHFDCLSLTSKVRTSDNLKANILKVKAVLSGLGEKISTLDIEQFSQKYKLYAPEEIIKKFFEIY